MFEYMNNYNDWIWLYFTRNYCSWACRSFFLQHNLSFEAFFKHVIKKKQHFHTAPIVMLPNWKFHANITTVNYIEAIYYNTLQQFLLWSVIWQFFGASTNGRVLFFYDKLRILQLVATASYLSND